MNTTESNMKSMNTRGWVAIIVAIVIAASGVSFGAIQGNVKGELEEVQSRLDKHDIYIMELRENSAVILNELAHMNKKLDKILNGE